MAAAARSVLVAVVGKTVLASRRVGATRPVAAVIRPLGRGRRWMAKFVPDGGLLLCLLISGFFTVIPGTNWEYSNVTQTQGLLATAQVVRIDRIRHDGRGHDYTTVNVRAARACGAGADRDERGHPGQHGRRAGRRHDHRSGRPQPYPLPCTRSPSAAHLQPVVGHAAGGFRPALRGVYSSGPRSSNEQAAAGRAPCPRPIGDRPAPSGSHPDRPGARDEPQP
jgi:hypothetical protein